MSLFTETVTIEHPGGENGEFDDLGRPVVEPPREETVSAWYEPRSSSEDVAARDQQNYGYWVYMPRVTVVEPQARIRLEGEWFEVDGEPGRSPGGFELGGYLSVAVRRVTG